MKREMKLLTMLLALIVLCGAAMFLTGLDLNAEEEADTSVTVITLDTTQITSLSWENLEEEPLSFTLDDGQWTYDSDSAFPADTTGRHGGRPRGDSCLPGH